MHICLKNGTHELISESNAEDMLRTIIRDGCGDDVLDLLDMVVGKKEEDAKEEIVNQYTRRVVDVTGTIKNILYQFDDYMKNQKAFKRELQHLEGLSKALYIE